METIKRMNGQIEVVMSESEFISLKWATELYLEYLQNKEKEPSNEGFLFDSSKDFQMIYDKFHANELL